MVCQYIFVAALLIFGNNQVCYGNEFAISPEAVQWGTDIIKVGMKMAKGNPVKIALSLTGEMGQVIDYYKKKPNVINEKMINLSNQLDSLVINVTNVQTYLIDELSSAIPDMTELRACLKDISKIISYVEGKYSDYVAYARNPLIFEKVTFVDFANSITSQDIHGLPHLLKTLHEAFYTRNDDVSGDTVLSLLSSNVLATQSMCERKQSLQQMLYILYNTIELADVKGFAMIQAAYDFKTAFVENSGGFKGEKDRATTLFRERMNKMLENVKSAMKSSSRTVWTCDSTYRNGVTYTKFDNLFSSYVLNEMSLNYLGSCVSQCLSPYGKKPQDCHDGLCQQQKQCDGIVHDCQTIDRPASICLSSPESDRKYDFIEYGESTKSCENTKVQANAWRIITTDSCDYCMCTCDSLENPKSDRYVNLRSVIADLENNYVVTGMRFVKENHILHIQIKQGKLLPGGAIDESTNDWKSIESYEIDKPITGTDKVPVENSDFHKIEWAILNVPVSLNRWGIATSAAFNLDDIDLSNLSEKEKESFNNIMNPDKTLDWGQLEPKQYHLVTGIRFSRNEVKESGYHLYLEIYMTPFNFTTGDMYIEKSFWHSKYDRFTDKGFDYNTFENVTDKSEIKLDNLDLPTNSEVRAMPTSGSNQFLKLTTSSAETDGGQSTIPFIDLTSVETNPPTAISGAGLMHKSSTGTGGFLGLRLFTIDYEPYINTDDE